MINIMYHKHDNGVSEVKWVMKHKLATMDMLGLVPYFIHDDDPDPAAKQFEKRYIGGWLPQTDFKMYENRIVGDGPIYRLIAEAQLRDETIRFYDGSWVAIIQKDGSFEVSRMD